MQKPFRYVPVDRLSAASPLRTAAEAALAYILMCTLYIVLSSRYAAAVANTRYNLQFIETGKGVAFVAVTGLIYFAVAYAHFRKIYRQAATIAAQEVVLLKEERKIMSALSFAVIAHDLNNLLVPMYAIVDTIHKHEKENAFLQIACKDIENGIGPLSRLCNRISSSTALVLPDRKESVDIRDVLLKLASLARKHPSVRFCSISLPDMAPLSLVLNRVLLEEAVLNLLINAGHAAGKNGRIEIRVLCDSKNAILAVHDNGPGIPKDQIECIFDPCYTTKADGTGMGLLAVKAFAASCGGEISVSRSPLGGALFEIRIPLTNNPSPVPEAPACLPAESPL
jgi:K+-sensing histidine kinase KdpD